MDWFLILVLAQKKQLINVDFKRVKEEENCRYLQAVFAAAAVANVISFCSSSLYLESIQPVGLIFEGKVRSLLYSGKRLARAKHSSLFALKISNKENV